jgi:hypothetical protein
MSGGFVGSSLTPVVFGYQLEPSAAKIIGRESVPKQAAVNLGACVGCKVSGYAVSRTRRLRQYFQIQKAEVYCNPIQFHCWFSTTL